jgi:hypothetical protein
MSFSFPLLLLLLFVTATDARCRSLYEPLDFYGWQITNDNSCVGWVVDRNYSCGVANLSIPTNDPNATYLHLGVGTNCVSPESGPCAPYDPTNRVYGRTSGSVTISSPELNLSNTYNCGLHAELSNGNTRTFIVNLGGSHGIWLNNELVPSGLLPAWSDYSRDVDASLTRIVFMYSNTFGYGTEGTLFSVRNVYLLCNGIIVGPNVTSRCWTQLSVTPPVTPRYPTAAVTTAAPTAAITAATSDDSYEQLSQPGLSPTVSAANHMDWNSYIVLAGMWIFNILTYYEVSDTICVSVMQTFIVLLVFNFCSDD